MKIKLLGAILILMLTSCTYNYGRGGHSRWNGFHPLPPTSYWHPGGHYHR